MIDLSRSCLKCINLQKNEKRELTCGITHNPVHFEDSCDLFELNKVIQESLDRVEENNIKYNYASIGKRIGNYFIDAIFIIVLESILGILVIKFYGIDSGIYSLLFNDDYGRLIFVLLLNMVYYSMFESINGKTPGKYFTRTKVLTIKGEKPDWSRILLRTVCRFVPLDQISYVFNDKTGWHDRLSKTIVIEE